MERILRCLRKLGDLDHQLDTVAEVGLRYVELIGVQLVTPPPYPVLR